MLKLQTTDIADIKIGTTDIQKVMYLNDIIWQRGGIVPQPCFEVVSSIASASGDYTDVYCTGDSKWYKKNNLNAYEEYGVMPTVNSLSNVTYYVGKLVILSTDSHEYRWTGSTWNDLGEVADEYTEYEYIQGNGTSYIKTDYIPNDNTSAEVDIQGRLASSPTVSDGEAHPFGCYYQGASTMYRFKWIYPGRGSLGYGGIRFDYGDTIAHNRDQSVISRGVVKINGSGGYINNTQLVSFSNQHVTGVNCPVCIFGILYYDNSAQQVKLQSGINIYNGKIYGVKIYESDTLVRNYVPATKNGVVGMYDTVNKSLRSSEVSTPFTVGGTSTEHGGVPVEYDTKVAPPDYVSYSTLEELEMAECPWVGMHAYVGGVLYVYTSNLEWVEAEIPYESQYLTFKAQETGTFTLTIHANVTTSNVTSVSYSVDNGSTWVTTQNSSSQVIITTPTIASGGTVLWKGTANNYGISNSYRSVFSSTCNFEAYGNTMSLLYGDNFSGQTTLTSSRTFNCLFEGCATITSAANLILPATTLTANCYDHMLSKCTSLTTAPALPATTLSQECYSCMFDGSTSLVAAPELPATTLVTFCYYAMFNGCTSLNYIKCLATNISASYSTYVWVQNVASSGTFVKASSASWGTGNNGIPSNWTVQNAT